MAEGSKPHPIAIIGMGCRFSGNADSPEKLWDMLAEGRSGWTKIPESRFKVDGLYHPDSQRTGTTHVNGGHFLEQDIASFDASFFSIPGQVANTLDPQYRVQLEVVYEALESAGIPLEKIMGSDTSVYGGIMFRDYHDLLCRDPDQLPRYFMTSNAATMASNRVSHFYDLRGPSMSVDTGCSTTLTALHLACQSLRAKECTMSIVTGASLMINPDVFISMSSLGFLSADGMSFAFDDRANGYGRGEGVAAVVLKRLDDAIRDGDPIRAVVRETATNQDGRTPTITTPSKDAQIELIRSCYQRVGLDPSQTSYVEAHGTGTPTGDPLEVSAIITALRPDKCETSPLFMGSVKSNIGHTEATSGLASIIKAALVLEKGQIPPNGNFVTLNEKLTKSLRKGNVQIPTSVRPWPWDKHIARASINNFGFGGANAHAILERYSKPHERCQQGATNGVNGGHDKARGDTSKLFILSAKDEKACQRMTTDLIEYLHQSSAADDNALLDNLAHTLGSRRSRLPWIAMQQACSPEDLEAKLRSGKFRATRVSDKVPRLGWVFTGQGAQWFAMGRELIAKYPVFRDALLECDGYITEMGSTWSIIEELYRCEQDTNVNMAKYSLPLSTAVQIALVNLLWSWNIKPAAVTSHSSGEIASAYAAGALDMRAAIGITYIRGALTTVLKEAKSRRGGMIAVGLGREDANSYISRVTSGQLVVACVNSPSSVTISGDVDGIAEIEQSLKGDDIFARRLHVNEAFHSDHQLPTAGLFGSALISLLRPGSGVGSVIYYSPKTGDRVADLSILCTPAHWVEAMLQPVEFESAFTRMCLGESDISGKSLALDAVIEIGPHGALGGPIKQIMASPQFGTDVVPYSSCLFRGKDSVETMDQLIIDLTKHGYHVNLDAVNFPNGRPYVKVLHDLPKYPWNHQNKYWVESRINKAYRQRSFACHDLLGSMQISSNSSRPTWRHFVRSSEIPWIRDHIVNSQIIYPGAGYIAMAVEGITQLFDNQNGKLKNYNLKDIEFHKPLVIPDDDEGVEIQLAMSRCDQQSLGLKDWHEFHVSSVSRNNEWAEHCKGMIQVEFASSSHARHSLSVLNSAVFRRHIDPRDLWSALQSVGIHHGPAFQNLLDIQVNRHGSMVTISIADTASVMSNNYQNRHVIHPTTLDSVIQAAYTTLKRAGTQMDVAFVPRSIEMIRISANIHAAAGHKFDVLSKLDENSTLSFQSSSSVFGNGPDALIDMKNLSFQSLGSASTLKPGSNISSSWQWAADISLSNAKRIKEEMKENISDTEVQTMLDLRRVSLHFIQRAVEALSAADIESLTSHHKKYYMWMKKQLDLASNDHFAPTSSAWLNSSPQEMVHLLQRVALGSRNGEMLCHLGPRIVQMLRHELSPLELMLQDNLLTKYYAEALKWNRANAHAAQIASLCAHKWPQSNILEIGGGTGSCTQSILDKFAEKGLSFGRYDFTDTSPGFFESARERFSQWQDVMRFRKLDIERNPADQGFEEGTYDVIIACQVLHATKNMENTISNVHRLLRPGGKLILVETTRDELDLCFIFGLLPGWWLSEEPQRKWSPSLTLPFWDTVLTKNQFSGLELEVHDCENEDFYQISAIMSTAIEPPRLSSSDNIVIVTNVELAHSEWTNGLQNAITDTVNAKVSIEPLEEVDTSNKICIFIGEMSGPCLLEVSSTPFRSITNMAVKSKGFLWISSGATMDCKNPHQSLHLGLLRTLRTEYGGRAFVSLDLDSERPLFTKLTQDCILEVLIRSLLDYEPDVPRDNEFAERNGSLLVARAIKDVAPVSKSLSAAGSSHNELFAQSERPLKLDIGTPGLLDTLFFTDDLDARTELPSDHVEIDVRAYGLNFRDIMVAMGQLNSSAMGFECSGIISRVGQDASAQGFMPGDQVASLLQRGWRTRARAHWTSVMRIPADIGFVEAASYPLAFATAYVALHETAKLKNGEKILIHAASGGTGQAAISLAQHIGAEVFVTVGSQTKIELVSQKFGIPRDHVFSSRETSFVQGILAKTDGHGIDVVLNSLSGRFLQESFNCLCEFGRFVEIGKRDLEQNSRLDMHAFTKNLTFASIDMLKWQKSKGSEITRVMQEIGQLLHQKAIRLISPISTYPISSVEKPFRLMQAGQHMGKVVITVGKDERVPVVSQEAPFSFKSNASYLIVGGLGGLGSSICEWMIEKGAENIIVASRSAKETKFLHELQQKCNVRAVVCDMADCAQLKELLVGCADMPPIQGVIQAAMVLQDVILERMTADDFHAAVQPKVQGSWNLHEQLTNLDFFVMLSSLVGVMGGASQANYAAGGTFQDALAAHRRSLGLPAVTVDLGMVKSIGYVAGARGVTERLAKIGYKPLQEHEVFEILEAAITNPSAPQMITGINTGPGQHWNDANWLKENRFAALKYRPPLQGGTAYGCVNNSVTTHTSLRNELRHATSLQNASTAILKALSLKLMTMFGLEEDDLDGSKTVADYGVDSLIAVELRNWIVVQTEADMSMFELMQSTSLIQLSALITMKSNSVDSALKSTA